jgi:hypothetical protein
MEGCDGRKDGHDGRKEGCDGRKEYDLLYSLMRGNRVGRPGNG